MVIDGRVIEDILYTFVNGEKVVQYYEDSGEAFAEFMRVSLDVPAILYNVYRKSYTCNQEGYRIKITRGI